MLRGISWVSQKEIKVKKLLFISTKSLSLYTLIGCSISSSPDCPHNCYRRNIRTFYFFSSVSKSSNWFVLKNLDYCCFFLENLDFGVSFLKWLFFCLTSFNVRLQRTRFFADTILSWMYVKATAYKWWFKLKPL